MNTRDSLILLAVSTLATAHTGIAQTTIASPKQPDKVAIASANARQLLLLMDADKNGQNLKKNG
jgi:5S rRNA maturation endonuclease (ribonuclease M5)